MIALWMNMFFHDIVHVGFDSRKPVLLKRNAANSATETSKNIDNLHVAIAVDILSREGITKWVIRL